LKYEKQISIELNKKNMINFLSMDIEYYTIRNFISNRNWMACYIIRYCDLTFTVLIITSLLFLDDIITPVYVAPTRLPTTLRPKLHKENIQVKISCDDEEDCEEGSGDSRTTEEIFVTSATGPYSRLLFCLIYF